MPLAPLRKVQFNGNKVTTAWFDFKAFEEPGEDRFEKYTEENFNQEQIAESVDRVIEIILKEVDLLGSAKKVFVAGFSEGAAISLATWIKY